MECRLSLAQKACRASPVVVSDLFTEALLERGTAGPLQVEREGAGLHPTSLSWWLKQPSGKEPADFGALSIVQDGPVLDVGCATGRHIEWLTSAGLQAEGIDVNSHAVELAKLSGARVTCADVWQFMPSRRYRWVLALGNNIGIAGRLANLPLLLGHLAGFLLPGGRILLSSVVPDDRDTASSSCFPAYSGEMRLRHHYAGRVGDWFEWLYVDPSVLAAHAQLVGLQTRVVEWIGPAYLAVLTRQMASHDVGL